MASLPSIRLRAGREKLIAQGHPWVFSGAVDHLEGDAVAGDEVDVTAEDGRWLARGIIHPGAALRVRLYSWNPDEALDDDLLAARLHSALRLRAALFGAPDTDSYRLVFSESDRLSGLVVDRYADHLLAQVGALALVPRLPGLLALLRQHTGAGHIALAADADAVAREGLDATAIAALGDAAVERVPITQSGLRFLVDVGTGQKTGFYLDQRDNRRRVAAYAAGREVLSAYCYTGAFEVYAGAAGATRLTGIDSSAAALERAREHHALNATAAPLDYIRDDVPTMLRRLRDAVRTFGLIILDPPRFVANREQKERGLRAYKDINLWALKLLTPGGVLATFSCSGLVSADDLLTAVRWAALDAGRTVRVLETLGQPADHPILLSFPESRYLKGYILWAE